MSKVTLLSDTIGFFLELEADNSAAYFQRERSRYDAARRSFTEMCDRLHGWGSWRVYRAHNDRRFRTDTPQYKTFLGAVSERPDGVGAFVRVDSSGVLVGTGIPMPASDQLLRLRVAVSDLRSGERLEQAIGAACAAGLTVHGGRWPPLKRVPRGYPADSPRADLLRLRGVEANVRISAPAWISLGDAVAAIDTWMNASFELQQWLAEWVGPSSLTPEERFAPRLTR